MNPEFVDHPVRQGFVVVDAVHNRRVPFVADAAAERERVDADSFRFPVSAAAAVDARQLSLPYLVGCFVRTVDGEMVGEVDHATDDAYPAGEYLVELNTPIKLYLQVDGAFAVDATGDRTEFTFPEVTRVRVGARSLHERPAGTITVTEDPRDVLDAMSLLGSSLKTLSPERSFPTLRGHPPRVEFGDEFAVPDGIERPETGVAIELPPEPEYLLPVASLAHYLGADLREGARPRLVTGDGFTHGLDSDRGFEAEVRRVLEQVFTLDCVVRTEGLYPVDLHERDLVEPRVDFEFAEVYDRSIPEQLETYLGVDYEAVADAVPDWCLAVDCRPTLDVVEYLPFVANSLGVVRTNRWSEAESNPRLRERFEEFTRSAELTRGPSAARSGTRGSRDATVDSVTEQASFTEVPPADAINHAWVGDEWPYNADKLMKAGFENRLARFEADADDDYIDVIVVCNDDEMRDEYADTPLYGDRDELLFNVETHTETTAEELRELLARPSDFFHYIGHVEGYEFVCDDGGLDVRELETVGARAFLLNGCTSFAQGERLVEAGSVAGIVTLNDVGNRSAVEIGRQLARLLNRGFPIGVALSVLQDHWLASNQYLAIGDTTAGVVQTETVVTCLFRLSKTGADSYSMTFTYYPTMNQGIGGIASPFLDAADSFDIVPGTVPTIDGLSRAEIEAFFDQEPLPVVYRGEFEWSSDVGL